MYKKLDKDKSQVLRVHNDGFASRVAFPYPVPCPKECVRFDAVDIARITVQDLGRKVETKLL
jgi:hypothetical protein